MSIRPNSVKKIQPPQLRDDEHFAIGVVEILVLHGLRDEVEARRHASLRVHVAGGGDRSHAINEGQALLRE